MEVLAYCFIFCFYIINARQGKAMERVIPCTKKGL